jgi:hypothetical protein
VQYRPSPLQPWPTVKRHKKHVTLNRVGVPDTKVDSSVRKSLYQDIMKFSTELNPIYGWKAQSDECQSHLRE